MRIENWKKVALILFQFSIFNFQFAAHASAQSLVDKLKRDSNSAIETRRGIKAYNAKQYGPASDAFAKANGYKSSPAALFNLGTARIAAGRREEGSAALTQSMADRSLRADALYNRGNSALAANAYDYAIRDYIESLKIRPTDLATKRNLEIALQRKQQSQQQSGGGGKQKNPQGSSPDQEKNQQPSPGKKTNPQQPQQSRDTNADALLRAVQQQEQEELARMKRAKATGRVGW